MIELSVAPRPPLPDRLSIEVGVPGALWHLVVTAVGLGAAGVDFYEIARTFHEEASREAYSPRR